MDEVHGVCCFGCDVTAELRVCTAATCTKKFHHVCVLEAYESRGWAEVEVGKEVCLVSELHL